MVRRFAMQRSFIEHLLRRGCSTLATLAAGIRDTPEFAKEGEVYMRSGESGWEQMDAWRLDHFASEYEILRRLLDAAGRGSMVECIVTREVSVFSGSASLSDVPKTASSLRVDLTRRLR